MRIWGEAFDRAPSFQVGGIRAVLRIVAAKGHVCNEGGVGREGLVIRDKDGRERSYAEVVSIRSLHVLQRREFEQGQGEQGIVQDGLRQEALADLAWRSEAVEALLVVDFR